jgi:NADH-quinone oxidoreductase subunit B/C/D
VSPEALLATLRSRLGDAALQVQELGGEVSATLERERALGCLAALRDDPELRANLLVDLTVVDRPGRSPRFEVVYHLAALDASAPAGELLPLLHRIRARVGVPASHGELGSAAGLYPVAAWLEREAWDLYGIGFEGHPDLRRVLLEPGFDGHPLRKDFDPDALGPDPLPPSSAAPPSAWLFSPAQDAPRLALQLDGERIDDLDVQVGRAHRGFEKECEARSWQQGALYAERLNYQSGALSATAYCLAVEKLAGIAAPLRAQWLRMLAGELARAGDHLTRLGRTCRALGAAGPFGAAMEAREQVWDLLEALSGARVTPGWVCVGGVRSAEPEGFAEHLEAELTALERLLREFDRSAPPTRAFASRLRGVGVLSAGRLLELGVTGPLLRAAGVAYDLRRAEPCLPYEGVEFDVPIGSAGDCLDRFLVCREEITQSLEIARQCAALLRHMRAEPIAIAVPGAEDLDAAAGTRRARTLAPGEAYSAVESSNGELGFYVVSDGRPRPCKVRCRPPSFVHAGALREMLRGAWLADAAPVVALLNCVQGECDR